jgi:pyridoxine/pyridoxamine 5'-phosphate oxidase
MKTLDSSPEDQNFFYAFMNTHKLCVISTTHASGRPEAAVVGFGQTPELQIIFGTDTTSRKYQNLMRDPHVAFVIGWENGETVQYEGEAREMTPDELHFVDEYYLKKSPESAKHRANPNNRYFIVAPSWIRYTDLKHNPWNIRELTF